MVALRVPLNAAAALAVQNGERAADLHLTCAYMGPDASALDPAKLDDLRERLATLAAATRPIVGRASGSGVFLTDDGDVAVVLVDAPHLAAFRQHVVQAVADAGLEVDRERGFVPHVTIQYQEDGASPPPLPAPVDVVFGAVSLVLAGEHEDFAMTGEDAGAQDVEKSEESDTDIFLRTHKRTRPSVVRRTRRIVKYRVPDNPRSGIAEVVEEVLQNDEELAAEVAAWSAKITAALDAQIAKAEYVDRRHVRLAKAAADQAAVRDAELAPVREAVARIVGPLVAAQIAKRAQRDADDAEREAEERAIDVYDGEEHVYRAAEFLDHEDQERCRVCGVAAWRHEGVEDDGETFKAVAGTLAPGQPGNFLQDLFEEAASEDAADQKEMTR